MRQLTLDLGLAPAPTLDNFFVTVGAVPDVAFSARTSADAALQHLRLALADPDLPRTPTLLWGQTGTGKSHLLYAVRAALQAQGRKVGWLDAQTRVGADFDHKWDAVLLDDCQRFDAAQQALAFNWFVNALSPAAGPPRWVLASADRPPTDLPLRADLRSRLAWGLVYHLPVLNEADRLHVLRAQAAARGLLLADEVLSVMLQRCARDLGSLVALLERLDRYALCTQRALTVPLLKAVLEQS